MENLKNKQVEKLAADIDANLEWYLQVSLLAGLFVAFRTFAWRFWSGVRKCMFILLAAPLDWIEMSISNDETVQQVSNLLRRLNFNTYRGNWKYDVNPTAGDDIMIGTVRLPTSSWFIWYMSLLELCNYIWIHDEGKSLHYVGPASIIFELVSLSNLVKGQHTNMEAHLDELRATIQRCSQSRPIQVCSWIELLLTATALLSVGDFYTWKVPLLVALLPLLYHGTQRLRQHFACCQDWLRGPAHGDARTGLELQPVDEQELLNNPPIAPPDLPPLQITRNYSILLPHSGGWYDIAINKEYARPEDNQRDLDCEGSRNFVTLHVRETNPDLIVTRLNFQGERCIYVCAHNPLASVTSITALRKMTITADNSIVLVVILPNIQLITEALEMNGRIGYPNHHSPIASYADWHGWLQQLTSGIFASLLLVLPYSEAADLQCETYNICRWEMTDLSQNRHLNSRVRP